jgi:ABC-type bacteriocin/lantibiotic exporter with double-glycine peptidase domain
MKHARILLFGMASLATATCAAWRSYPPGGGVEYLGRDGIFFQHTATDCGGAALTMIFDRFDIAMEYRVLLERLHTGTEGAAMSSMKELAQSAGLLCEGWRLAPHDLSVVPLPAILLLRPHHFVVLAGVSSPHWVLILDPMRGRLRVPVRRLLAVWTGESLLFSKPGDGAGLHGRWFARPRSMERRTPE